MKVNYLVSGTVLTDAALVDLKELATSHSTLPSNTPKFRIVCGVVSSGQVIHTYVLLSLVIQIHLYPQ